MKHHLLIPLLITFSSLVQGAPPTYSVAVFPLETGEGLPKNLGADVAVLIGARLSSSPNLIVLERAQLDDILGEQGLSLTGAVSQEAAVKAGGLLGARVLVTGRIFKSSGGKVTYVVKVIGTETGRVYGETATGTDKDTETTSLQLAEKIASTVAERGETLVAKVETREEWVARVGAMVKGKPRPTISVKIPEQHLSRPIPDPAAETEIKILLRELGFTVVESGGEVEVVGEAFSEMGLRKGSLTACRARVEIKMTTSKKPGQEWNDRETAGGIDLAEMVAAKNALQTAGQRLSERIAITAAKMAE